MAFEERFSISIPDAEASRLTTPRKVADYVYGKVAERGATREHVGAIVREVIEEHTAITNFSEDSDFVRDMGLN